MAKATSELTMYGRSLLEAERTLATHKDVVVPVKEVWLEVSKLGQLQRFEVPPLIHFSALLEADERFEFIQAGEELGDEYVEPAYDEDDEEYSAEMERMSFYSEDRVRLRNAEISEELAEEMPEEPDEPALREPVDHDEGPPGEKKPRKKAMKPAKAPSAKKKSKPSKSTAGKKQKGKRK
ncbi:MAG: hypothetical protein L0Y80_05000 [Ignavibacteriae bacterium]|nr:hypothetical protein [Ignavibacteriota bacterium]